MFKAWQVVVSIGATAFMLVSIDAGTPFWVSVVSALLLMSILASDAGIGFAVGALRHSSRLKEIAMKVKITRGYKGMPEGANVGDEVDIDDGDFAEQRRLGNVERAQAQGGKNAQANQQTPGAGQPQDRPGANQQENQQRGSTQVPPVTTQRFGGDDSNR